MASARVIPTNLRSAFAAIAVLVSVCAEAHAADPRPPGKAVIPESASEGGRDVARLARPLGAFVKGQPYGRTWKQIVRVERPPRRTQELGAAESRPELARDPIEMQEQVQFLDETGVEERYGLVSIRGVRVFRHGRLVAVQLVLDRIGRDESERARFDEDIRALAGPLADPRELLGLGSGFEVTHSYLVRTSSDAAKRVPGPPFRIEIKPTDRRKR